MTKVRKAEAVRIGRFYNSPTYYSWSGAKARCRDPKSKSWPNYGGRGITFAPEWDDFRVFILHMGVRPPGTTLDRINNDRGYEPGNCRWADKKTQANNRRRPEVRHDLLRAARLVAEAYAIARNEPHTPEDGLKWQVLLMHVNKAQELIAKRAAGYPRPSEKPGI